MFGKKQETPDFEMFTIFDSKVQVYREPMLAINRHDILRQIDALYRDPKNQNNQLFSNAEDFSLFKVGEYSKLTGIITSTPHEHIANLHDIRAAVQRRQQLPVPPLERDATSGFGIN